jgi:DNA segregation ATPase FtsK/SpoIIIE, S-DNA-T family
MLVRNVTGEQIAQVDNPDPFASPVWRSPVYRTPEFVILFVQFLRLLVRLAWFIVRHPLLDAAAGLVAVAWLRAGWPGMVVLAAVVLAVLVVLRVAWPAWFIRLVSGPARCRWRWWFYRRHWQAVMTIARLAPTYRGRVVVPVLGRVRVTGCADLVKVKLVSGQAPADFAARAESIAHGFRVHLCRVRTGRPGAVVLELVRRDALADPMPALPIPEITDLRALPVGRREDGAPFTVRLQGTHLLIAGATGAGKGSYLWGLVRAMLPAMAAGLVSPWACDPKLMETGVREGAV